MKTILVWVALGLVAAAAASQDAGAPTDRLVAAISAALPGHRLAAGDNKLIVADLNGDGRQDAAAVVAGRGGWKFVIFEGTRDGYRLAYVFDPARRRKGELLEAFWNTGAPPAAERVFVSKVPAGTKWAPEGGDTFQPGDEVLLKHDGVDVLASDTEIGVIVWQDGKYQNLRARF